MVDKHATATSHEKLRGLIQERICSSPTPWIAFGLLLSHADERQRQSLERRLLLTAMAELLA